MNLEPVSLAGRFVRLEPLAQEHIEPLAAVALHPEIWRWTTNILFSREDVAKYVADALQAQRAGTALPFATVESASGQVVGCTRFMNIEPAHRRVEIGSTFVSPRWQRTAINTEAKFLMLQYAFGTLNCIRVEFKTDALNTQSRAAILRLGAREEGTLRSHMIVQGGRYRDSVYFSITSREWFNVSVNLQQRLNRSGTPSS